MDVEIRFVNINKGKGLFAKKPFLKGDVILIEKPFVCCQFSWNSLYKYKACDHCLRPLETAEENARRLTGKADLFLPHPECCTTNKSSIVSCEDCGIEYCSTECLLEAKMQYHLTLCLRSREQNGSHPLELLDETWRNMHYPPETSSIMLIARLLARIIQSEDQNLLISQILQFCHKSINEDAELFHKFLEDKFTDQISTLLVLFQQFFHQEPVQQFLTEEGFKSLLALIGTNGQGVGTSAISQWVQRVSDVTFPGQVEESLENLIDKLYEDLDAQSGSFLNNEGVALYTLQSAVNHSCIPNAQVEFVHNDFHLSLVALKNIAADEEILISYLDDCNLRRSRHSRRKELMQHYLFSCICQKCEDQIDQVDCTSDEDYESMSE